MSGRRLTISTPEPPGAPANLLIFHDGQNLGAWRAVETIGALAASGAIGPTVIAAIDHLEARRIREFGYGASGYARFIVREVVPYMRDHYAISCDRASTWIAGSSMGGLVTLYTAALYPDVFGKLFVFSPSVWWNRRAILRTIQRPGIVASFLARRSVGADGSRASGLRSDVDVWLSIGLKEGDTAVDDTRRLRDTLTSMRHGDASRLRYYEDPEGSHSEESWAAQLEKALSTDTL